MADPETAAPYDPTTLAPRPAPPAPPPEDRARSLTGEADILGRWKEIQKQREETEMQRREEMEPALDRASAAVGKPYPEAPTLQSAPPPPRQQFQENMRGWMQSAMILGAIGGALGRKHVTNALAAFSGAVEGFKSGQQDLAKQNMEQWHAESQKVAADNKAMIDQYNLVLKSRSLDIDQKMNEVQLLATKWQDRAAYDAASNKNVTELARYIQQQEYHTEQLRLQAERIHTMARTAASKAAAKETGKLDDEAVNMLAEQLLKGDKSALQNVGRGTQGAENLAAIRNRTAQLAKERGIDASQMAGINQEFAAKAAGLRTAYTQEAKMGTAAAEAEKTMPLARQAIAALPRGDYLPLNKLYAYLGTQSGSPEQAVALTATLAVVNAYAAVMGRGNNVVTVSAREEAKHLLDSAMSPEAYNAVLDQMEKEMKAVLSSPEESRARLRGDAAGGKPDPEKDPLGIRK